MFLCIAREVLEHHTGFSLSMDITYQKNPNGTRKTHGLKTQYMTNQGQNIDFSALLCRQVYCP